MVINDAIAVVKPDEDSHYRLLPCKCGCDNAAYVKYNIKAKEQWRVQCFTCGFVVDPGTDVRHAVQVVWNATMRPPAGERRTTCINLPA